MGAENIRIVEELFDVFQAEKDLDEAGVVVMEGAEDRVALEGAEFDPFLLRERSPAFID